MASGSILKPVGWKARQAISLPFTPTRDGIVFVRVKPSSSATAYYYIAEDGTNYANVIALSGANGTVTMPVSIGKQYTNTYSSGVDSVNMYFFEI